MVTKVILELKNHQSIVIIAYPIRMKILLNDHEPFN